MDFREFQYVVTIADCHSITEAAKQLYISQPSLSYALSKIEKEAGMKLFDRSKQPLVLTEAGEYYVKQARQFLRDKKNFVSKLGDLKNECGGTVNLGIPAERSGYMLPPVLKAFREKYPFSSFSIREAGTIELFSLLRNNKVSFIVVPFNREDLPAHMTAEYIYPESMILVAAADAFPDEFFLDPQCRLVDLSKVAEHTPFIGIKKRHSIHGKVEKLFCKANVSPSLLLEEESSISAAQLAAGGLGFTIVPSRVKAILGKDADACCYQCIPHPIRWEVNAIYKDNTYLNKAERYLIQLLRNHFGEKKS
jgi:DNA-binding transcriptional LysR family regulator